jgi:hypothetical protein
MKALENAERRAIEHAPGAMTAGIEFGDMTCITSTRRSSDGAIDNGDRIGYTDR